MELDKAIKARKSVRHFSDKKPNWRDIIECIDVVSYAPRAGNLNPLRFLIVDDKEKIEKLAEAAQQPFVKEAQYVVVVCTDPKMILNAYPEFAIKFCRQQAGAAIENFLLKIEEKGLETCWVGYFIDALVRETLNIPEYIDIEALFPIGYESKKPGAGRGLKKRIDLNRLLFFNKWNNKRMKK